MTDENTGIPAAPEAPESAKWGPWAYHHVRANREALMKPAVIGAVLAAMVGGIYLGFHEAASELKIKDDTIAFLTIQNAALKDGAHAASDKPQRSLSSEEKTCLIPALSSMSPKPSQVIVASFDDPESNIYGEQISTVLARAGVKPLRAAAIQTKTSDVGLLIGLKSQSSSSAISFEIMNVLNRCNIKFGITDFIGEAKGLEAELEMGRSDCDILV